ncbi:MAG TPA: NAD(+) diphosphatase [Thermoanaerobaculia bacterium]|nr:NAD(+) diphosphatase [Thermoanaerobaculia bacterium]
MSESFDRSHLRRTDSAWLEAARERGGYILLRGESVVLSTGGSLFWRADELSPIGSLDPITFLGGEEKPVFAVRMEDEAWSRLTESGEALLIGWRELVGEHQISDASLAAYAISLDRWHERSRYCGRCGASTQAQDAGHSRRCTQETCGERYFPRTDPVAIAVVIREDRCLLGRHNRARGSRFFTALAGFVEPGESAEEAVAREIFEEAGVRVRSTRYFASQPWPFPHSLMLGFHATTDDETIRIDSEELVEARWFTREEILAGTIPIPPPFAIAHQLIMAWARREV